MGPVVHWSRLCVWQEKICTKQTNLSQGTVLVSRIRITEANDVPLSKIKHIVHTKIDITTSRFLISFSWTMRTSLWFRWMRTLRPSSTLALISDKIGESLLFGLSFILRTRRETKREEREHNEEKSIYILQWIHHFWWTISCVVRGCVNGYHICHISARSVSWQHCMRESNPQASITAGNWSERCPTN